MVLVAVAIANPPWIENEDQIQNGSSGSRFSAEGGLPRSGGRMIGRQGKTEGMKERPSPGSRCVREVPRVEAHERRLWISFILL